MMDDMIRGLDDSQAVRVLKTFARARLRAGGVAETEWTPELDRALRRIFRPRPTRGVPPPSPRATWPARRCSSWPTTHKTAMRSPP